MPFAVVFSDLLHCLPDFLNNSFYLTNHRHEHFFPLVIGMITLWYCPLFLRHRLQSSKLKNTPLNKSEINVGFNGIRKQVRWRLYSTYTAVKNSSENFSFFVARFANTTQWSSFFPHYCHYLKSLLLCCSERCYRIEILWQSDIFCSSVEVLLKV